MQRTLFCGLALGVSGILGLSGCSRPAPHEAGRLASPREGSVRLLAVKVAQTPDKVHYQWSLLGDRNWTTPSVGAGVAALAGVYPLNDPRRTGGCPTWLCDTVFTRDGAGWKWELRLHGSNGKTARATGTSTSAPEILVQQDQEVRLPAQVGLARAADTTLSLQIPQ